MGCFAMCVRFATIGGVLAEAVVQGTQWGKVDVVFPLLGSYVKDGISD
jgi:hypothetical protein